MLRKENSKRSTWVVILLFIINVIIFNVISADEPGPNDNGNENDTGLLESITTTVQIDFGEIFYIYFDPENLELEAKPPEDLPEECDQALALVPDWLRGNLSYKFRQLSSDYQTIYANLILGSPEDRYIDEIAFSIAHSAVENLQDDYFFPELLTHNAQLIYDNDQYLEYVEVVERGDYTTVVYKDRNNMSVEAPKDIYYWYIVLPKLSDELATYVDPEYNYVYDAPHDRNYGVPPPTGKFWRDWLFYHNDSGYPLLKDYLDDCYTVWEAISACNSWMSGSMSFTSDEERPIQPVRIYRKHIGRCGEYQDMRNAIARAGLIPSTCTCNSAEDHVWNEFWDQRWIHWDGTVDNPMMYENGWGKDISSVWNTRGDGHIWSVTDKYTLTCNFTALVLDDSGLPVDGVLVDLATENYYNPDLLTTTTWGITDYTGTVTIPLGDYRNYWSSAESDTLGTDPLNGVTQVITNSEAGVNYTYTFNLPISAPVLRASEINPPGGGEEKFMMEVTYEVEANIVRAENSFTGEHGDQYGPSGNIDFFIADSLNYGLYSNDLSFEAYHVDERSTSGIVSFMLHDEDRYYAVLSNEFAQESMKLVNITVNIYSPIKVEITGPPNNSEIDHGELVFITGTAWGPKGISIVEIDLDGLGNWVPAADTSGGNEEPYSTWQYNLDTMQIKPGMYTILAKASFEENSSITSINISLIDVTNPEVVMESPTEGSIYWLGETFTVNGSATDNGWINVMKLIINSDEANSTDITSFLVDGFWSYEIYADDLGYGDHTITVWVNDTASNYAMISRNIRIQEAVPPDVRIDTPFEDSIHKLGSKVEISGMATDNTEIVAMEIIVDDNKTFDIISELMEDGFWSFDWDTKDMDSDGEHILEVRVTDGSGNIASDVVHLILDGTTPLCSIIGPYDNQIFRVGDPIGVTGLASDDLGLFKVELILDNEEPVDITDDVENNQWEYTLWDTVALEGGIHTISVSVTDFADQKNLDMVHVMMDEKRPEVEIEPVTGSVKNGDLAVLQGTVTDDTGISELILEIDNNIQINITSMIVNENWDYMWDTSIMSEGIHSIKVIAIDFVDNQVSDNIKVVLIGEAPKATIYIQDDDMIFKAGEDIPLYGTAIDDWKLDKVEILLDDTKSKDITWRLSEGKWEYDYWDTGSLESGAHIITVSVTDSVGLNSRASIEVMIDNEIPEVGITKIEEQIEIGDSIWLSGFAYDDIGIKEIILIIDDDEQIDITPMLINGDWEYQWDTSSMSEGTCIISVLVTDHVDNQVSEDIRVRFVEGTTTEESYTLAPSDTEKYLGLSYVDAVALLIFIIIILCLVAFLLIYKRKGKGK